jgi:hypothetical protein
MEELLGFVARSVVRHAVVGVLTGGLGNIGTLIGDVMDLGELADHLDTVTSVDTSDSSGSGDVLFGGMIVTLIRTTSIRLTPVPYSKRH